MRPNLPVALRGRKRPAFEQYEAVDGVAWVTLDRPEVHNAFNLQMQTELQHLWRSLRGDAEVRCVVLTGAGDASFCTGIDRGEAMDHLLEGPDARRPFADADVWHLEDPGRRIGPKSNDLWKPVIAAVNGMACGGAFYLLERWSSSSRPSTPPSSIRTSPTG
jgi:enoyl-CoA hydratase/carnithine racemase